jgi:phage-related minor tail protein
LRTLGEETEQVGKQMEAVTTRAFNGMTDALTNFVMTGKLISEFLQRQSFRT